MRYIVRLLCVQDDCNAFSKFGTKYDIFNTSFDSQQENSVSLILRIMSHSNVFVLNLTAVLSISQETISLRVGVLSSSGNFKLVYL